MKFKKFICGLLSLGFIFGGEMSVSAMPMGKILDKMDEMGYFAFDKRLDEIRRITLDFLQEEKKLSFYDHAPERSDSLAFAFFCYLCVCKNPGTSGYLELALNRACEHRSAHEHAEDIAVIDDIFPHNVMEFEKRFGVEFNEQKRLELSDFLRKYKYESASPDLSPVIKYRCTEPEHRKERKPNRKFSEAMLEGKELAEEGYGVTENVISQDEMFEGIELDEEGYGD